MSRGRAMAGHARFVWGMGDPNAGIVGSFFASKLEKCLTAYFGDAPLKASDLKRRRIALRVQSCGLAAPLGSLACSTAATDSTARSARLRAS